MNKLILLPLVLLLAFPSISYGQLNKGFINTNSSIFSSLFSRISSGFSGLGGSFGGGGATSAWGGGGSSSSSGMLTFGGRITAVWPCTCSTGLMAILVGPPKGGIFIYSLTTSKLYNNMKPVTGSWVIGDYSTSLQYCFQIGTPCYVYPPTQGTITRIGTS